MGCGRKLRPFGLVAGLIVLIGACSFEGGKGSTGDGDGGGDGDGDGDGGGDALPWWDVSFEFRQRLMVATGPLVPDKGYVGYTARLAGFDADKRIVSAELQPDCSDLRVAIWDGATWTEVARDVTGCPGENAAVAFALPLDLAADESWPNAFLYYGDANSSAAPAPTVTTQNVYLWWDDASQNRNADYDHGRLDAWLGIGHEDSMTHNGAGYYEYATGDDSQSGYRRAVDERDVIIEAEFFHTGCFPINMQTGVCVRGIIASGSGATESSDHYYCTTRAQNPNCANDDQGIYDGDIVGGDNESISLQGVNDPPPIVTDEWRKQALGAYGINPTELRFWDSDAGWAGRGFPDTAAIQATGSDNDDFEGRGFAAIMTSQDAARVRHIVVRRYVEPEPAVTLAGTAENRP